MAYMSAESTMYFQTSKTEFFSYRIFAKFDDLEPE